MSSRIYCYYPVFLRKKPDLIFKICAVLSVSVEQDHRLSLAAFPVIELHVVPPYFRCPQ